MAESNIVKNFRWRLEIGGVDQFLIQKCTLPDIEIAEVLHRGSIDDADIKTPAKKKVGDLVVNKLMSTILTDTWAWEWINSVLVTPRAAYARYAFLKIMDETGLRTIAIYDLGEIWPKKVKGLELDKGGDGDNVMEEVTFSVSKFAKIPTG